MRFFYFDNETAGILVREDTKTWTFVDNEADPLTIFSAFDELQLGEVIQVSDELFDLGEAGFYDDDADVYFFDSPCKDEFLQKISEFIDSYDALVLAHA